MGRPRRRARRLVTIEVLEPGPLTTVQDPFGRPGWRHVGVPVGGAADPWSARLANRLVGNRDDAALLEITLGGALVAPIGRAWMALTGGLRAETGGIELPINEAWRLRPGGSLRIRAADGARGYLAIGGGLEVEPVLGSAGHRPARRLRRPRGSSPAGRRSARGWTDDRPAGPLDRHSRRPARSGSWPARTRSRSSPRRRTGLSRSRRTGRACGSMGRASRAARCPRWASARRDPGAAGRPPDRHARRPPGDRRLSRPGVRHPRRHRARRPAADRRLADVRIGHGRRAVEALREAEAELAKFEPVEAGDDDELGWAGSHG